MPRIGRAVLPVTDLDVAIDWYRTNLDLHVLFDDEIFDGFRSVHVGSGEPADAGIWLFPVGTASDAQLPSLVLYSDDLDQDAARLDRGHAEAAQPLQGRRGARSMQVRDPWGNTIVLTETPR